MGSFDAVEVCELVGLFILHKLREIMDQDNEVFIDDFLIFIENSSGRKIDKIRKQVISFTLSLGI